MFLLYDVIQRRESQLGYHLLLKSSIYKQTQKRIQNITLLQLKLAATEIKNTRRCTNPAILNLERQIQGVAKTASHLHSRCAEQAVHIKALMVSDGMPTLWMTLNLSDLQSPLVLSFARVKLDSQITDATAKRLRESTSVINLVAVA